MEILRKNDGLNMESESLLKLVNEKCPYLRPKEPPQERALIIKDLLKLYASSIEFMDNVNDGSHFGNIGSHNIESHNDSMVVKGDSK